MSKVKKVWVNSLFGRFKGIQDKDGVQLVGYPFGSYPEGKRIECPEDRITSRQSALGD